jgi:zinc D-Ala-D-Ala dipeptidase
MRSILISSLLATSVASAAAQPSGLPSECRQCLIVTTDSWTATRGELRMFERSNGAPWHLRESPVPVEVGKSGLAWGRGVLTFPGFDGPQKREGDNKAPAGVFRLASVFGYARHAPATRMPYLPLSDNIVGVDDPQSRYYNQLVDKSQIPHPDWRSGEKMILADDRYKWGIVVEHNVPPKPGAGSCIFLHVWKSPKTTTTGCTAMPETAALHLIKWLDPARHPLLIQLPSSIYRELRAPWHLPARGLQQEDASAE